MKARVLNTLIKDFETPEILSVKYDLDTLEIKYSTSKNDEYLIKFNNPIGFKCLHERDMMDYWESKVLTDNWILEIIEAGWLDMEKSRTMISDNMFEFREFLIKGYDDCISVFAREEPCIEK
jgi:hypothetical protein